MKPIVIRTITIWLLAISGCLLVGCGSPRIDATYGKRRGNPGYASVNGTSVLADMFEQSGAKVNSRTTLSKAMDNFDVIVWAPDDFGEPASDVRDFLEQWLAGGTNRTLIYIGRDYDAEITYWQQCQATSPPEQAVEVIRRLARARAAHARRRASMPDGVQSSWFTIRRDAKKERIGFGSEEPVSLGGTWGQNESIPSSDLAIEIHGRLNPPRQRSRGTAVGGYARETLLTADGNMLAYRLSEREWGSGQIIVIENGSFLLNLPLVWKGHRELANKLIADCGQPKRVAFLESTPGSLSVFDSEMSSNSPTGLEAFTVWPLGAILWHLLAVGVVLLFSRIMIFGRPHELAPEQVSDFGRHIQATGEMLASTGDRNYALQLLDEYNDKVKHDGKSKSD